MNSANEDNLQKQPLTARLLAEKNKQTEERTTIREWAADLPQVPDTIQPKVSSSQVYEMNNDTGNETKDVLNDSQKVAYVGLCYLTSLEIVHDYQGKDFSLARMSADNWQRKLMRMIYAHMDIPAEEITMIESLSRHQILPTDLVHQFTAQGDTAEVKLDNFFKNNKSMVIIDLRWTVLCDLFLVCFTIENYDARSRVFVARVASYLSLDWFQVIGFEKRIAEHLVQDVAWDTQSVSSVSTSTSGMTITLSDGDGSVKNLSERNSRNKQRKKRRHVMVGLATIGGGLILGLSAGLMAPVIAGGIGVLLSTVGVTGSAGFLGGTAGIALITGGATVAGGRIGGRGMSRRMKSITTFEFLPIYTEENVNCMITITGWLPNKIKQEAWLPFSTLDEIMGDHYTLYWEPEMLEELGSAFRILATEAVTFSIQQALAHTIMGALLAGLAWPLALTKLGYMVDNPWANALDRSKIAGLVLADTLMNRNLGARPITLVGFSLGARTVFYCLLELARMKAFGLVESVVIFGTPVNASKAEWRDCTTVVSGRFINGYATNDWLLGFLFRTSTAGLGNIAGLRPLVQVEGDRIKNMDCTDLVTGHLSYRTAMPKLLKRAGFVVTSEELPIKCKDSETLIDQEMTPENHHAPMPSTSVSLSLYDKKPVTDSEIIANIIDSANAVASSRTYSSLSSGKASIAPRTRRFTINSPLNLDRAKDIDPKRQTIFGTSLFGRKKTLDDPVKMELKEAGVEIKEIKSTLGRLVVPKDISHPVPQVKLELPQNVLLNR